MMFDRRLIKQFDWPLLGIALLIPLLGLINLYSAGFERDAAYRIVPFLPVTVASQAFARQVLFLSLGLVVLCAAILVPTSFLQRYAWLLYGACVALLVAVLVGGVVVNGSRRWLSLGGFNLQPAEPMKLALILALARYLSRNPPRRGGYTLPQLIFPGLILLVPMGLVMKQPDLGSALSLGIIGGAMILFMGVNVRVLLAGLLVVAAGAWPAWHSLYPYQQRRILTLFNPDADPRGSGYHIIQSKIAVGSGELFGKGYLQGTQTQLEFLPEHTTDFIFSVLGEEWGFLGCVFVLALYLYFISRLLRVAARSKDLFDSMVTVGIAAVFFFHVLINVAMVIGLLPVVGIPLPLFSHGGSAVVSAMVGLGIVLGISMRRFMYRGRT